MKSCATASQVLGEPLAATAATAPTWLLVEQPGPWGAKALTASHLDPELGAALDRAAAPHGVRVALIRRPGRHADPGGRAPRRLYLAHTLPGDSWIRTTEVPGQPQDLLDLDFAALGRGDATAAGPGWEPHHGEPLALVCTNGKRDRCCALLGRPLAAELAASAAADVWEVTHLGGHRFAPTLLVLPYGYAYGRIGAHTVKDVLDAVRRGQVLTGSCRGRSAWDRPGQAADLAVRARVREPRAGALTVTGTEPDGEGRWSVGVAHTDGRRWRVRVAAVPGVEAPASCGAAPGTADRMHVEAVEECARGTADGRA
ncbi:sucrase ferredoxin [Streptomyces sp. JJ36]|uniref:sucrase ferredoxin n=1 Tax=Streptomyces sp. JJ36 TaxID=2736645 RepID=UPI001F1CDFF3|nr:sucrase ferredoxin [Streptomyces sp. JJ36]MCF6522769.1 sucrase ferredoxin [Streptomyces sp. JJ36]